MVLASAAQAWFDVRCKLKLSLKVGFCWLKQTYRHVINFQTAVSASSGKTQNSIQKKYFK